MIESYSDAELISVISELKDIQAMRVTTTTCVKSGILVGAAATIGGLLFGPKGIALGSVLAGVGASAATEGTFRSVPDILMNDLNEVQKRKLADALRNLLTSENVMTVAMLSTRLMTEDGLRLGLELVVKNFLKEAFNYCA